MPASPGGAVDPTAWPAAGRPAAAVARGRGETPRLAWLAGAVLAAAWTDYGKSNPPSDDKAFLDGWMKARAAALAKADMPNGFED